MAGPASLTPEMSLNLLSLSELVHGPSERELLGEGLSWGPEIAHLPGGRKISEPVGNMAATSLFVPTGPVSD